MTKQKELTITAEEGQGLLRLSSVFALPEKIGENSYTPVERALASEEVRKLYRELRVHSPMMRKPERWQLFGPEDNFRALTNEEGAAGYRMMNPTKPVKITLDEDADSGLVWLLIYALHPASPNCQGVAVQEDLFWPLVEKAKRVRAVKEALGLDKATPRRWASDDDERREEKEPVKEKA